MPRLQHLMRGPLVGVLGLMLVAGLGPTPAGAFGMPSLDATKPLGAQAVPAPKTEGAGLSPPSFTAAQAARGQTAYTRYCAECHGRNLDDGEFGGPPLKGSNFRDHWGQGTLDALYGFLSTAMPPDRPGRLTPQTYADITAYLLQRNGYEPGTQELPADLDRLGSMTLARP